MTGCNIWTVTYIMNRKTKMLEYVSVSASEGVSTCSTDRRIHRFLTNIYRNDSLTLGSLCSHQRDQIMWLDLRWWSSENQSLIPLKAVQGDHTHCFNYFFIHFESYTLQCCVVRCSDPMLLAVNANAPFMEPCNGWTKCVCVFGIGKSRVAWAMKLHV